MSAVSEIKFRVDTDLKKQFENKCREAGTTMSAEINHLILAATEPQVGHVEVADENDEPTENLEQTTIEEIPLAKAVFDQLESLLSLAAKIHADRPQAWIDQWYKTLIEPQFATSAKRHTEQNQFHSTLMNSLAEIHDRLGSVIRNTQRIEPRFYRDYKFWTAFTGGIFALVLILALLPGETAPTRFLARKIVGGKNDVHAAGIMAGGDSFTGKLMQETRALMKTEPFASDYARCVERATNARKSTRCTLSFPAITSQ